MKLKTITAPVVLMLAVFLTSCTSTKGSLPYFTDITEIKEGTLPRENYTPDIKPDDELMITVMSENPEATALYNQPLTNPATVKTLELSTSTRNLTYIVSSTGDINFPLLGKIHVAGLTAEQLQDKLTEMISKDVENPIVRVVLMNFSVTIAGEVKTPQRIPVTTNRISILDALSAAGDLTEYGDRTSVLVIREEDGIRKYAHLNLNSSDVLTSPYYYLQQNDYVYVAPNKIRQANSKYNQNNAFKLSVVSTIVSAASVIASLVIALTVK